MTKFCCLTLDYQKRLQHEDRRQYGGYKEQLNPRTYQLLDWRKGHMWSSTRQEGTRLLGNSLLWIPLLKLQDDELIFTKQLTLKTKSIRVVSMVVRVVLMCIFFQEYCVFKFIHTQNYVNLENDVISIFAHLASASSVDDEERKLKDKEKYCHWPAHDQGQPAGLHPGHLHHVLHHNVHGGPDPVPVEDDGKLQHPAEDHVLNPPCDGTTAAGAEICLTVDVWRCWVNIDTNLDSLFSKSNIKFYIE